MLHGWGSSIYTPEPQRLIALLREMREQAGMTHTDLADKLGRTQTYITHYETNRRRIEFIERLAILQVFGATLSDLAATYEEWPGKGR